MLAAATLWRARVRDLPAALWRFGRSFAYYLAYCSVMLVCISAAGRISRAISI